MKSVCNPKVCFLSYILLSSLTYAQPRLSVTPSGCQLEGRCNGTTRGATLDFKASQDRPLSSCESDCNRSFPGFNVTVFREDSSEDSYRFRYLITDPLSCPEAGGDLFNPTITCTSSGESATETVSLNARITDLQCVKREGTYDLSWTNEGCTDSTAIVTLSAQAGQDSPMHRLVANNTVSITHSTSELIHAYVAPTLSADGRGDAYTLCQDIGRDPVAKTHRPEIYRAIPMHNFDGTLESLALQPGQAFRLDIEAPPASFLSIASMQLESNDQFLGFSDDGLPLFNMTTGQPLYQQSMDVSGRLLLWDAGTELDEKPGVGKGQPFMGNHPTPDDPRREVRRYDNQFGNIPAELARFEIQHTGPGENGTHAFSVSLINNGKRISPNPGCAERNITFSPAICVIHGKGKPLFTEGQPDYGEGLKLLAEEGDPRSLLVQLTNSAVGDLCTLVLVVMSAILPLSMLY